jgi:hypothetical protein
MKRVLILILFVSLSSLGAVEDEVNLEKTVQHVEMLVEYSPRLAGSGTADDGIIGGDYSAALYIADTLREYNYDVEIEEFSFTTFQITEFALIVDFDGDFSTPDQLDLTDRAVPPTMRYSDISYDMAVPLVFLDETTDIQTTTPGFEYWLYHDTQYSDIARQSSIALVYKENEPAFMSFLRETFSISYEDYLLLKERETANTIVWVKFSSHSEEVTGYNVVGMRRGRARTVVLTAHYDSVYTDGAIDNGSGVAALLETARILSDKHVGATMYFVFFDAEEIGLLGSEAFVIDHEFPQSVCINVDSIASGDTVYVGAFARYEDLWESYFFTDSNLDMHVASIAEEILGYIPERLYLEDVGGYSDFVSFTKKGVPSTDITTLDKEAAKIPVISEEKLSEHATPWVRGGRAVYIQEDRFSKVIPYIHTSHDDLDHFDKALFYDTTRVVVKAAHDLSRTREGEIEPVYISVVGLAAAVFIIWHLRKSA